MTNQTVHEKLDTLLEYSIRHDEHLKNLNGTVARHEEDILKIEKEHTESFKELDKRASELEKKVFAVGVVLGVGYVILKLFGIL